jgi:hypothetical protein
MRPEPRLFPLCVRFGTVALFTPLAVRAQGAPADTVRIAITRTVPAAARQGAIMSVEESARVATLLGRAVVLDSGDAGAARARFVITGDASPLPPRSRAILLDVECSPPPRGAASARWFTLCPPAARSSATQDSVVAWDAALEKFGASQLNDRYRARWRAPMTEAAWRGWLAAKIAWESALRGPRDPAALARWLASPAARFDGHQGVPLSFDARHRLRHPRHRVLHRESTRILEALP